MLNESSRDYQYHMFVDILADMVMTYITEKEKEGTGEKKDGGDWCGS